MSTFNEDAYVANMANLAGVSADKVTVSYVTNRLRALSTSTTVITTIVTEDVERANAVTVTIQQYDATSLGQTLGVSIASFSPPQTVQVNVFPPSPSPPSPPDVPPTIQGQSADKSSDSTAGVVIAVCAIVAIAAIIVTVVVVRRQVRQKPRSTTAVKTVSVTTIDNPVAVASVSTTSNAGGSVEMEDKI